MPRCPNEAVFNKGATLYKLAILCMCSKAQNVALILLYNKDNTVSNNQAKPKANSEENRIVD